MADFCKRCSEYLFDKDFGDLKGVAGSGNMASVICEGCSSTWVDNDGVCIAIDCEVCRAKLT